MRSKLLLLISLWIATAAVVFSIPGCYGENCNGETSTYGLDEAQGHMVSDTLWESNADNEAWLPFPRQRGYSFEVPALGGRTPTLVVPYLSANEFQSTPGSNQVIGAGNIATMYFKRPNGINITNDTCSDYYLRLVMVLPPTPPAPAPADAGTP